MWRMEHVRRERRPSLLWELLKAVSVITCCRQPLHGVRCGTSVTASRAQSKSVFAGQVGWELVRSPALLLHLVRYFSTVKVRPVESARLPRRMHGYPAVCGGCPCSFRCLCGW